MEPEKKGSSLGVFPSQALILAGSKVTGSDEALLDVEVSQQAPPTLPNFLGRTWPHPLSKIWTQAEVEINSQVGRLHKTT